MTVQISQLGKKYLKTVQTLLRTAETMSDQAIAAQLKTLADGYERRTEIASSPMQSIARSALSAIRAAYMS